MNVEEGEKLLDRMNQKIIKTDKMINRIPIKFIRIYCWKKLSKFMSARDRHFKELREATREKYPERFA